MSKAEMVQFIQEIEHYLRDRGATDEFIEMLYHFIVQTTEELVQVSYKVSNQKRIKEHDVRFGVKFGR